MEYYYDNIANIPNLSTHDVDDVQVSGIHYDVANSDMSNKSISYCRWDEDVEELHVHFAIELSAEDKTKLDTIVANNS